MAHSIYCYPGTDIFKNKLGLKDGQMLERAERKLVMIRLGELKIKPVVGEFDFAHLQSIHRYLFQDLYDFAGKLRNEQIGKGYFQFANPLFFNEMFQGLHHQLTGEHFLKGLEKRPFAERLAYYMAEINVIHPFRDGNGRAIREYVRCLAMAAGYTLRWSRVDKDELLEATIHSITDSGNLANLLFKAIVEEEPSEAVIRRWEGMT